VTLTIKSRIVTVKGPRGELVRNFKHCSLDMTLIEDGDKLQMDMWFATKKQLSALGSVMSHINNMMVGVVQVRFQLACPLLGIARGCWRAQRCWNFSVLRAPCGEAAGLVLRLAGGWLSWWLPRSWLR